MNPRSMTRIEAHRLLDGITHGVPATLQEINEALMETGDLDCSTTTHSHIEAGKWERGAPANETTWMVFA